MATEIVVAAAPAAAQGMAGTAGSFGAMAAGLAVATAMGWTVALTTATAMALNAMKPPA